MNTGFDDIVIKQKSIFFCLKRAWIISSAREIKFISKAFAFIQFLCISPKVGEYRLLRLDMRH